MNTYHFILIVSTVVITRIAQFQWHFGGNMKFPAPIEEEVSLMSHTPLCIFPMLTSPKILVHFV